MKNIRLGSDVNMLFETISVEVEESDLMNQTLNKHH